MYSKTWLVVGLLASLFDMFQQINKITLLSTPSISFAHGSFGYTTIKAKWKTSFNHDIDTLTDLNMRIVFPFAVATPLTIGWIPIDEVCDKIRRVNTVTTTTLAGDETGSHYFVMKGAKFSRSGQFYLEITLYDFPVAGFQGQLRFSVISTTTSLNHLVYAYNSNFMNLYFYPNPGSALTVSTAPTSTSTNYNIITKSFFALIDVTFTTTNAGSRVFFRLAAQSFRYDSAQTCEVLQVATYTYYAPGTYSCYFEDEINFKGLYFVLNSGSFATGTKVRFQLKMTNPTLPSSSTLKVALMKKFEPKILDYVSLAAAFTCTAAAFQTGYPKLFYGPSLDTSAASYPSLPLFRTPGAANRVVFNSIRVDFYLGIDLPEPADHYKVLIKVGGSANTRVPLNYIYDNLNKAASKTRKITSVAANGDITIINVGEFSSLNSYSLGFKLILYGDEALSWAGATAFASIQIVDSSGTILVAQTAPVGVNAAAKTVNMQGLYSVVNLPTIFHSVPSGTAAASFGAAVTATQYGLSKATDNMLLLKGTLGNGMGGVGLVSYIEVIANPAIVPRATISWADANAAANCITATNVPAENTATVLQSCYYTYMNKGTTNEEYALLRMGAKTSAFWSTGTDIYWGWRSFELSVSHSFYMNDGDAAILDAYINLYASTGVNVISTPVLSPVAVRYLDNMQVINRAALTNFKIEYANYYRNAADTFNDNVGSTFLRISGVLDGVNTFKAQKILIFYTNFDPLYLDSTNYEIGCSGSDVNPVRCFAKGGVLDGNIPCSSGTCSNMLFREMIEIHFTTSTIAVSNAQNIQIVIPIKMKVGAHVDLVIPTAIASVHTGTFSEYDQIIEYVETIQLLKPSTPAAGLFSTLAVAPASINLASSYKPYLFQVDSTIKGVIGTPFSSNFNVDCSTGGAPFKCAVPAINNYYSMTMCANWNFMSDPTFSVTNTGETFDVPDIYRSCIKNLRYQYSLLGVPTMKYCLWCPMFTNSPALQDLSFKNMVLPDFYNHNWPPNTYSMFSGTQTVYGIENYLDFSLQTAISFIENHIGLVSITPSTWYKSYKSMKLQLRFETNNRVMVGGTIQMVANTIMPLVFIQTPNPYCFVQLAKDLTTKFTCTATCTTGAAGKIVVTMTQEVPAGDIILSIYGTSVSAVIAQSYGTFYVVTTTAAGTTANFFLDKSDSEAVSVQFESFPGSNVNVPDVIFVNSRDNDQAALSILNVTVSLSNSKQLYMNDLLKLTFDATPAIAAYNSNDKPFYCYIVDSQGYLVTAFKTCYAQTPTALNSGLMVSTDSESGLSLFNIVLENFDLINGVPQYGVDVQTANGVGTYVATQTMAAQKVFTAHNTYPSFVLFTVAKSFNYGGGRPELQLTFRTTSTQVQYTSRILVQLHKSYDPSMIENIHNCRLIDPSNVVSEVYCFVEKFGVLEITGFSPSIASGSTFSVLVAGLPQPQISSVNEYFYAKLLDSDGVLKESGVASALAPNPLSSLGAGLSLLNIYDLAFSTNFIRSTNDLTFTFVSASNIAATSRIFLFLDYYTYEYVTLPIAGITCTMTVGGTSVGTGTCTRVGKRIELTNSGAINANDVVKVKISGLVTLNYASCEISKVSMHVVQAGVLIGLVPGAYVDSNLMSADLDPSLIYLNFAGLSDLSFINIQRGLYNRLDVIRMDGLRFNDELNYTLKNNFNNQFTSLNPQDIEQRDSYLGEASIPILIGSSKTSILSIFLIEVNKIEAFKTGRFAPLPFLVLKTTSDKLPLPVPASLNVYRGYQSLPMILTLNQLPVEDMKVDLSIVTYDLGNLLQLKSAATFTLSKSNIVSEVEVKYTKAITSDPVSLTTSVLKLDVPADAPYMTTYVTLNVVDLVVDTSSKFSVTIVDTNPYGCLVDIKVHMPLTVYYYFVPRYLYSNLTSAYVESMIKKGKRTDGYIIYGKMNIENSVFGYDICNNELMTNTSYVLRMFYETFTVQTPTTIPNTTNSGNTSNGSNSSNSSNTTNNTTTSSTFNPLARVDFAKTTAVTKIEVTRLDKGETYQIFSTDMNTAPYGYIDLTFKADLTNLTKQDLCCYFAQALSYPLENVWTNDSYRCPSKMLPVNLTYFGGINFTVNATSRLLSEVQDFAQARNLAASTTSANNSVRLYLMRNARASQNAAAWSGLSSLIFASAFETGLKSQYASVPAIVSKTPLLQIDQIASSVTAFAKFTAFDNYKAGNLTGIKLSSAGILYCLILFKKPGLDQALTYQHVRLGINPQATNSTPVLVHRQVFASINDDFKLDMPEMTKDQTYVLYYFVTSQDPNLLPAFSPLYKYEFIIRSKTVTGKLAHLLHAGIFALGLLAALIS
jgi:hypothetical protein